MSAAIITTQIASANALHDLLPGRSLLKLCCEDDYGLPIGGCLADGNFPAGLSGMAPYWESKLGLSERWDFMPALINSGFLDYCPNVTNSPYVGKSVYTGARFYRGTWVPATAAWTFAALVANPLFDTSSRFLGVDGNDLKFQTYSGGYFNGVYATTPTGIFPGNTLPLNKPLFIQFQFDRASAVGSNLWINGQPFAGAAAWDLTGLAAPALLTLGGSTQFYFKATYGFDGKVSQTDLFAWVKQRYPELTFQ